MRLTQSMNTYQEGDRCKRLNDQTGEWRKGTIIEVSTIDTRETAVIQFDDAAWTESHLCLWLEKEDA